MDRAQSALRSAQAARVDSAASRSARDADIRRAETDLEQAQSRLDALRQGPKQVDIDLARNREQSAQLALDGARDKLERVRRGPDRAIDVATLAVSKGKLGVETAEAKLASVKAGPSDAQMATAVAAVESARSGLASANARLTELLSHPTTAEIRDGQDRVTLAQIALARAVNEASGFGDSADTSAYDLLLLQKSVEQDRSQVETLDQALDASRLRAPTAGVVTAVLASPGDSLQAGRPVISLARDGDPIVQAEVTDREATRLAVGQDSTLQIDGLDDVKLTGSITSISDRDVSGKIVTISAAWPAARILYGAAAQLSFDVEQRADALLVPEKAIRSNGARKYVEYVEGSSRRAVDVQTGVTGGGFVEVLKGLNEGQTVLVRP